MPNKHTVNNCDRLSFRDPVEIISCQLNEDLNDRSPIKTEPETREEMVMRLLKERRDR